MPLTTGFNHVATLTTDMDRTVRFYEEAFEGVVIGEVTKSEHHPWMKIVDLGGGSALNVFEVPAEDIIGERRTQGARGAVDHFGLAVDSLATLEAMPERLAKAGAQEVGQPQQLGGLWSLFFRDPDGMELEVCCAPEEVA
jgi:catechol 2,3-dioxygenase-like lactoylglutathione lyase family enzyme